jgi:hypothetical protein
MMGYKWVHPWVHGREEEKEIVSKLPTRAIFVGQQGNRLQKPDK